MTLLNTKEYILYSRFLKKLANDLTKHYYSKLNGTFKVSIIIINAIKDIIETTK